MATTSMSRGTTTAFTITLASLATSSTLLVGRESTAVALNGLDAIIGGKVTTGSSPTAARQIEVWSYASYDDTEYSGGATGSDAGLTLTAETKTLLRLVTIIPTHNTTDTPYKWGPFSVAEIFGFVPESFGLFITHNTGVNLNSTGGNHEAFYTLLNVSSS